MYIGNGTQLWWLSSSDKNVVIDEQIAQQYQVSIVNHNVSDGMVSSSLYINATVDVLLTCRVASSDSVCDAGVHLYVIHISPVRDLSLSIDDVPYVTSLGVARPLRDRSRNGLATPRLICNMDYTISYSS